MSLPVLLHVIIAVVLGVAMLTVAIFLLIEKAFRAAAFSLLFAVILPVPFIATFLLPEGVTGIYATIISVITIIAIVAFLYNPKRRKFAPCEPAKRHDERETMFSRRELNPGEPLYIEYYRQHPAHKQLDDNWRHKPGLLNPGSLFYHPVTFAAAEAYFSTIGKLGPHIKGEAKKTAIKISARWLNTFIKQMLRKQGMKDVGITRMKPAHYYHTKGRGATYNQTVTPRYHWGVAFTVEMDESMIKSAPKGAAVMESAEQYLHSGVPAVQLAAFLRELGYEAQAHIDGNYEVICPLVARDAGLGEIGRMGLLMTPRQGPRVRIAVVTTDAPLVTDEQDDLAYSMNEFCTLCKKCAAVCPSQAISFDDRTMQDGALRWKINSEACFSYWQTSGTDCARCMAVCPYAHTDNLLHNSVRFGIRHSKLFRLLAVKLDDLFYGKKPKSAPMPKWIPK